MIQLLLHLFGDYFLQNDWMAVNKSKYSVLGWLTCTIHCLLYATVFSYYGSWQLCFWIFITHFLIDKFPIVYYLNRLINGQWKVPSIQDDSVRLGFTMGRPFAITIWLHIIRDNSLHIAGNYFLIQHFIQ